MVKENQAMKNIVNKNIFKNMILAIKNFVIFSFTDSKSIPNYSNKDKKSSQEVLTFLNFNFAFFKVI